MKTMLTVKASKTEAAASNPQRSISSALAPVEKLCENSVNLVRKPLPPFVSGGREHFIPRYLFIGPKGGNDPLRVGLFAGVNGDQPEGSFALVEFIQRLEQAPALAKDFCLFFYPILNPSGFESGER